MQFVIVARDNKAADTLERRLAARAEHMEGVRRMKADGQIIDGGAILNAAGDMAGSVVLCEFRNRAELDAYLYREPYKRDKVWDDIEIIEFRRVDWQKLMVQRK